MHLSEKKTLYHLLQWKTSISCPKETVRIRMQEMRTKYHHYIQAKYWHLLRALLLLTRELSRREEVLQTR